MHAGLNELSAAIFLPSQRKFCLQNSLPVVNAYGNSHMYGAQHAAIPVTTSTIYGLPGFPFQYPTIPNTVPHTIMRFRFHSVVCCTATA
jgi:hypothetical protein